MTFDEFCQGRRHLGIVDPDIGRLVRDAVMNEQKKEILPVQLIERESSGTVPVS